MRKERITRRYLLIWNIVLLPFVFLSVNFKESKKIKINDVRDSRNGTLFHIKYINISLRTLLAVVHLGFQLSMGLFKNQSGPALIQQTPEIHSKR